MVINHLLNGMILQVVAKPKGQNRVVLIRSILRSQSNRPIRRPSCACGSRPWKSEPLGRILWMFSDFFFFGDVIFFVGGDFDYDINVNIHIIHI